MVERRVTIGDVLIYITMLFLLFLGFGEIFYPKMADFILRHFSEGALIVLAPYKFIAKYLTPLGSMILGYIVLLIYASKRFFRSSEMFCFVIFGSLFLIGYFNNIKLTEASYLTPLVKVFLIPQLVNVLIYAIFKAERW